MRHHLISRCCLSLSLSCLSSPPSFCAAGNGVAPPCPWMCLRSRAGQSEAPICPRFFSLLSRFTQPGVFFSRSDLSHLCPHSFPHCSSLSLPLSAPPCGGSSRALPLPSLHASPCAFTRTRTSPHRYRQTSRLMVKARFEERRRTTHLRALCLPSLMLSLLPSAGKRVCAGPSGIRSVECRAPARLPQDIAVRRDLRGDRCALRLSSESAHFDMPATAASRSHFLFENGRQVISWAPSPSLVIASVRASIAGPAHPRPPSCLHPVGQEGGRAGGTAVSSACKRTHICACLCP